MNSEDLKYHVSVSLEIKDGLSILIKKFTLPDVNAHVTGMVSFTGKAYIGANCSQEILPLQRRKRSSDELHRLGM